MNFFLHMSAVVVMNYAIFRYWYVLANRFDVLNFHEKAFLPARYIMSGVVAAAIVYWAYLIPVALASRFFKRYWHPTPGALWFATSIISGVHIVVAVHQAADPPLTLRTSFLVTLHVVLIQFYMFRNGSKIATRSRQIFYPGIAIALLYMADWLFWIGYSFFTTIDESVTTGPRPMIGSIEGRLALALLVFLFMLPGLQRLTGFRLDIATSWRFEPPPIIQEHAIDMLTGFYCAWALFYLTVPAGHYMVRGYVIAHSNLFPAFLPGIFVPLLWSLFFMWPLLWLLNPLLDLQVPPTIKQMAFRLRQRIS